VHLNNLNAPVLNVLRTKRSPEQKNGQADCLTVCS